MLSVEKGVIKGCLASKISFYFYFFIIVFFGGGGEMVGETSLLWELRSLFSMLTVNTVN